MDDTQVGGKAHKAAEVLCSTSGRKCYCTHVILGGPKEGTNREVATEARPLQSRFMTSHEKNKRKKQGLAHNKPCLLVAHISHSHELNLGSPHFNCSVSEKAHVK